MGRETLIVWAERVRRWRASGVTAREFAVQEGVNRHTLSHWAWKLGRARVAPAFIEVIATPEIRDGGSIEIILRETLRIRVSGAFDATVLREVVAALEAR
jgi:transposase